MELNNLNVKYFINILDPLIKVYVLMYILS